MAINFKKTLIITFGIILFILTSFFITSNFNAANNPSACQGKDEISVKTNPDCINELYGSNFVNVGGTKIFDLNYTFEVTGVSTGKDSGR